MSDVQPEERCTECKGTGKVGSEWVPEGLLTEPVSQLDCEACDGTGDRVVQVTNALLQQDAVDFAAFRGVRVSFDPADPPRAVYVSTISGKSCTRHALHGGCVTIRGLVDETLHDAIYATGRENAGKKPSISQRVVRTFKRLFA